MPGRLFANLSDVLIALSEIGFTVTVLTLDAEDKALPTKPQDWSRRKPSSENSRKTACKFEVQKKFGIHNKAFCFLTRLLMGSVNMTHRGCLATVNRCQKSPSKATKKATINN